jgi:hypothetical protein
VVGVYVDDLVVTGASLDGIGMFKAEMAKVFNMSDLGLLHYYLGIEVRQSAEGFSLTQGAMPRKFWTRVEWKAATPISLQWNHVSS